MADAEDISNNPQKLELRIESAFKVFDQSFNRIKYFSPLPAI